ncbi:MAG: hypothetical protein V1799_11615 [bacterium]
MKKFFRSTYHAGIIVLFLVVVLGGMTQTRMFRSYLRTVVLSTLSKALEGEVQLGQIEGNLLTGFWIDSLRVNTSDSEIAFIDRVEARYDPLGFLFNKVSLSRITLLNPRFSLMRSGDSTWNFNRLFKSSTSDSTPSSWTITLGFVEIKNGSIVVKDSIGMKARSVIDSSRDRTEFDYADLAVHQFDLKASATIRRQEIRCEISSLSFESVEPEFHLVQLGGEFLVTPLLARIRNLSIETERTNFSLSVSLEKEDVLSLSNIAELEKTPVSLNLDVKQLDFKELKQWIGSSISFLDRTASGQILADGAFGNLEIKKCNVEFGSSSLHAVGSVMNLHRPENLELNLGSSRNILKPIDLLEHLPGLSLPDLRSIGETNFSWHFTGTPSLFDAQITMSTEAGQSEVNVNLDSRGDLLVYDATVKTLQLNLAKLFARQSLESRLNSTIKLKGQGTTTSSLLSTARVEIDSSEFNGYAIGSSVLVLDAADGVVRPHLLASINQARVDVSGKLTFFEQDSMLYELTGRINGLDLSDIIKNPRYSSNLNFAFSSQGRGLSLDRMRNDLALQFQHSTFSGVEFERGTVRTTINTFKQEHQTIELKSDAVDLTILGTVNPETFINALVDGATIFSDATRFRMAALDSLRAPGSFRVSDTTFYSSIHLRPDTVRARFALTVKDAFPIGVILGVDLAGQLSIGGEVQSDGDAISLTGRSTIRECLYDDHHTRLYAEDAQCSFSFAGLNPSTILSGITSQITCEAARFEINTLPLNTLSLRAGLTGGSSAFQLSTLIDSVATVSLKGLSEYQDGFVKIALQDLSIQFPSYQWSAAQPVECTIGRDGVYFNRLTVRHEVAAATVQGYGNPYGTSDITLSVTGFRLADLRFHHPGLRTDPTLRELDGQLSLVTHFSNTFESPNLSVELAASDVRYQETPLGKINGRYSYANQLLTLFMQVCKNGDSLSAVPDLLVKGTIPYTIVFSGNGERSVEGEMNLDVEATRFKLELLDPFISELDNLTGHMTCSMKMRGTISEPSYEGSVTLTQARFLFRPLGLMYIVDGKLVPQGKKIGLDNLTVNNIPEDRPDGKMNVSGTFSLYGLSIKDFDLIAKGQLVVMKESVRLPNLRFYGNLFTATGPDGLFWKGTPGISSLTGKLLVRNASITLPPTRESLELPSNRIPVSFVNDTLKATLMPAIQESIIGRSTGLLRFSGTNAKRNAQGRNGQAAAATLNTKSFLDNIVYNVQIETQGLTQLRFIFNNLTNEELFAELSGRTNFSKGQDQINFTGEVQLGAASYYNMVIRKLDASGKLNFTGDLLNPELDVVAKYEGFYNGQSGVVSTVNSLTKNDEERVVVNLLIKGTRDKPQVKTELKRYDQANNLLQSKGDDEANALSFIINGKFKDEQAEATLLSPSMLLGLTSSVLSGPLTDLLRKELGVFRSVDVLYSGGDMKDTDVRITGEIGDAVFRLGGKVLNDPLNTNISVQLPMSSLLGVEALRNLVLEAERRVQVAESFERRRESNGVRLLYRITF